MPNALADALSPYLRQHAENPVDWQQWGPAPFQEAERRDVPVFVSIGYSTCHWCHVMARESFSDPVLAKYLNEHFVAIKVDREEHPEVDSRYLSAASAFSQNLGWPLNVFVTPNGNAFFAGTYWPPEAMAGHPSFRQVLESVTDAWEQRRAEVETNAAAVAEAITAQGLRTKKVGGQELLGQDGLAAIVGLLARNEDAEFGGFGTAPKFPVVPVLTFLLQQPVFSSDAALNLADRTLTAMAKSPLRDPVEGGFFRYATRRNWSQPHYERMLYDNAQLLQAYALLAIRVPERAKFATEVATGIADFLLKVLRLPNGGFASAQNSESMVDGYLTEGDYFSLSAKERAKQVPPALDEKVLAGWNGLAVGALAAAGFQLGRSDWVAASREVSAAILSNHLTPGVELIRATVGGRSSTARATLEDYGLLASGLIQLGLATGEVKWAIAARKLVDSCRSAAAEAKSDSAFAVPGGGDPVLAQQGLSLELDPSEGAYPSGLSALADAARQLYLLTAERDYLAASEQSLRPVAMLALEQPLGFGAALATMASLAAKPSQLVVVSDDAESGLAGFVRSWFRTGGVGVVVTSIQAAQWAEAGFELFEARVAQHGIPTAYLCHDFVCRLPVTDVMKLGQEESGVNAEQ